MALSLAIRGSDHFVKASYPVRAGVYSEVETDSCILHFNLNQEIIRAQGKGDGWPHPQEWLQRTIGNDWVYYSTGGYAGVFEATGEYYLPNLPYRTNNILGGNPLQIAPVAALLETWHQRLCEIAAHHSGNAAEDAFLQAARRNGPTRLEQRAQEMFAIIGGRPSVLPPDTRHVDYRVVPLTVHRGCLYKCSFCRVKNKAAPSPLSAADIDRQIDRLACFFGDDLANHNSLFLGEHDALLADPELLCYAIEQAQRRLGLTSSNLAGSNVFLFGSVGSLRRAPRRLFDELERLPGRVYLNIGLESFDQATLDQLGKPLTSAEVGEAFATMLEINARFSSIEVTANLVIDDRLNEDHHQSLITLIRDRVGKTTSKGAIYLSPLSFGNPSRARLFSFYHLKRLSRLPLYLYTIQRL